MDSKDKAMEKRESGGEVERTRSARHYAPRVDIYETEEQLNLLADMPGVARDEVSVSLENGVLTIEGQGRQRVIDKGFRLISREFEPCGYYRMFTLSDEIDHEKIEAVMDKGVLRLVLPKSRAAVPRKINVKGG